MIRAGFGMTVVWPEYTMDFNKEGEQVHDEEGNVLIEASSEELEGQIEEVTAILSYGDFENEEKIQEYKEQIAKELGVLPSRIEIFYLDKEKDQPMLA